MQPFKYSPNNNSGSYRHRIIFLVQESLKDDLGQEVGAGWIEFKRAWSMIKTVKGSEYVAAAAEQGELIYRFVIHYMPGINKDMKIDLNGRIFDIIEPPINDDEMDKTLTILAKERL